MLRGCAPENSGCRRAVGYRVLGTLGSPAADGYVDVTSAYTGRFGAPAVGKRVFVSVNACTNGYEGIPLVFGACARRGLTPKEAKGALRASAWRALRWSVGALERWSVEALER